MSFDDIDELRTGKIYDVRLLRRLLVYLRPHRGLYLASLLFVMQSAALALVGPQILRFVIDYGIEFGQARVVIALALIFLVVETVRHGVDFFQQYLLRLLGLRVSFRLRMDVFEHLQKVPLAYYHGNPVGRIVTRSTNDVQAIQELFQTGLVLIVRDILLVTGASCAVLLTSWKLGLLVVSVSPLLAMTTWYFRGILRRAYRRVRSAISRLNATLQENLNGIGLVQLYGIEERRLDRFRSVSGELYDASMGSLRAHAIFSPFIDLSARLMIPLCLAFGGAWVSGGDPTVGIWAACLGYLPLIHTPIRDLGEKFDLLQRSMAAGERVVAILDEPPGIVDKPGLPSEPADALAKTGVQSAVASAKAGEVRFENVTFGYRPDRPVIRDVSLTIKPGERVAVVGATGAGKTTLSRLLARFYEPWQGRILIDGRDLRDIPLAQLRAHVGAVQQDVFLFSGTVLENVRLFDAAIPLDAARQACEWARLDPHLETMEEGMEHDVAEGGRNLSHGQRQLLAFARALVRQPRVLVLDEATASVDTRTERQIEESLNRVTSGRTCLLIAHRLATVKNADRIVVMEDGRIVEEGSPEELLRNPDGAFKRMHALQFKV